MSTCFCFYILDQFLNKLTEATGGASWIKNLNITGNITKPLYKEKTQSGSLSACQFHKGNLTFKTFFKVTASWVGKNGKFRLLKAYQ